MLRISTIAIATVVLFLTACSGKISKEELSKKISDEEKILFTEQQLTPPKQQCAELLDNYIEYAKLFPDEKMAPEYLFKAADLSIYLKQYEKTIKLYDQIFNKYPDFEKRPESLFLKGYVYENNLKDLDKARGSYNTFIEFYPNHPFTESAKISLRFLGATPEDVMKALLEEQQ